MLQRADTNDVRYAYRLILGREPDEGGWRHTVDGCARPL